MSAATELQSIVGDSLMQQICDRFGGQVVYIPATLPGRNRLILHDFNAVVPDCPSVHSAYETVAEAHHVSPRTVRRLVANG